MLHMGHPITFFCNPCCPCMQMNHLNMCFPYVLEVSPFNMCVDLSFQVIRRYMHGSIVVILCSLYVVVHSMINNLVAQLNIVMFITCSISDATSFPFLVGTHITCSMHRSSSMTIVAGSLVPLFSHHLQ